MPGVVDYHSLCLVAKNEKRQQAVLHNRQTYYRLGSSILTARQGRRATFSELSTTKSPVSKFNQNTGSDTHKCYNHGKVGHLAKCCHTRRAESNGSPGRSIMPSSNNSRAGVMQITIKKGSSEVQTYTSPNDFLYSSSPEDNSDDPNPIINQIRVLVCSGPCSVEAFAWYILISSITFWLLFNFSNGLAVHGFHQGTCTLLFSVSF